MQPLLTTLLAALGVAASAHASTFLATLEGTQEVPPVNTTAAGGAFLTVDLLTRSWSLSGAISNLVASPTGAHIHGPAPAGQNAGVLRSLGFNAEPEGPLTGGGDFSEVELGWLEDGLLYINVHTQTHPGGEIRGQLALVPEPSLYAWIAGLGLCAFAAHRRWNRHAQRQ